MTSRHSLLGTPESEPALRPAHGAVSSSNRGTEHSRLILLTWHFFRRFLDNDLVSPNGDAHVGISHAVAALLSPSLMVTSIVLFKYALAWRPTWARILNASVADGLLFVSLSMIVLGIAATVTWDAFFLDARDRHILSSLPVPDRLLSAAKLGALGLFLCIFVAAVNLIPAVLVPPLMVQGLRGPSAAGHLFPLMLAQIAALSLSGAWMVLAVVALRGVLPLILPARLFQRVSPIVQGVLILGLLAWALSLSPFIDAAPGVVARGGLARDLSPPLWFLGLYEWIIGHPWPEYEDLAHTGLQAIAVTLALVLAAFFAPKQRRAEHLQAAPAAGAFSGAVAALRTLAATLALRHPRGRASFVFTLTAMGRSTKHRLYLAAAIGAGLAWAATGLLLEFARHGRVALGTVVPSTSALQVQAVLVLFLIVAVRFGVLVPAVLTANWLFRVTERRPIGPYFAGARRAALVVGSIPVAVLLPLSAAAWGWQAAGYHALVGLLYAAFIVELFFNGLAKVPCTAAYVSGSLKLKSRGVYYLVGAGALTGLPSAVESFAFRGVVGMLTLPLWLVVLTAALAISRVQKERRLTGLVFDDSDGEAFQTLRLSE
jgi:hypothetical protein